MAPVNVLMAGLPGSMATLVAEAVEEDPRMNLLGIALGGEAHGGRVVLIGEKQVALYPPEEHEAQCEILRRSRDAGGGATIAVDFTTSEAAALNAERYVENGFPFVMGTTGGDELRMGRAVASGNICAVIAPNMAIPLVLFEAMTEWLSREFPGALSGFSLKPEESHQKSKSGPSGTAGRMIRLFEALGASVAEDLVSIRDPEVQRTLGIKNLLGHGYHWYNLRAADGSSGLRFITWVEGRKIYVPGTILAILFLAEAMKRRCQGRVSSMVDVIAGLPA